MSLGLRITPFTPRLHRTTRLKRSSNKDDNTFIDTSSDEPKYVTREDVESYHDSSDAKMKTLSAAWLNKYATRNGSPTLETFANPKAVEMINGRVAQIVSPWAVASKLKMAAASFWQALPFRNWLLEAVRTGRHLSKVHVEPGLLEGVRRGDEAMLLKQLEPHDVDVNATGTATTQLR